MCLSVLLQWQWLDLVDIVLVANAPGAIIIPLTQGMCQTVDCLCPACHPHEDKEVHIELALNLQPQAHTNTKGMGPLDVESNSKTEDALMLQDTTSLERPAVRRQACAKACGCFRRHPESSKHQLGV